MDQKVIAAISAGVVAIIGAIGKIILIKKNAKKKENLKEKHIFNKKIILNHEFFDKNIKQQNRLDNINLGTKGRTLLFRTMISIFLEEYYLQTREFVQNFSFKDDLNLYSKIDHLFYSIAQKSQYKWAKEGINNHDPKNDLSVVPRKISVWSIPKQELLLSIIKEICYNDIMYPDYTIKMHTILTMFIYNNEFLILEMHDVLTNLNGEITGKRFRGELI